MSESLSEKPDRRGDLVDPEIKRLAASWMRRSHENPSAFEGVHRAFAEALSLGRAVEHQPNRVSPHSVNEIPRATDRPVGNSFHRFLVGESKREEHASEESPPDSKAKIGDSYPVQIEDRSKSAARSNSTLTSHDKTGESTRVLRQTNGRVGPTVVLHSALTTSKNSDSTPFQVVSRSIASAPENSPVRSFPNSDIKPAPRSVEKIANLNRQNSGRESTSEPIRKIASQESLEPRAMIRHTLATVSRAGVQDSEKLVHAETGSIGLPSSARFDVHVGRGVLESRKAFGPSEASRIGPEHSFGSATPSSRSNTPSTSSSTSGAASPMLDLTAQGDIENQGSIWNGELAGIRETLHRLEADFRRANKSELPSGKRPVSSER